MWMSVEENRKQTRAVHNVDIRFKKALRGVPTSYANVFWDQ